MAIEIKPNSDIRGKSWFGKWLIQYFNIRNANPDRNTRPSRPILAEVYLAPIA
ncbi:MAG: hypothetical protein ACK5NT_15045 [Pyrinomonadaceae bacterium]